MAWYLKLAIAVPSLLVIYAIPVVIIRFVLLRKAKTFGEVRSQGLIYYILQFCVQCPAIEELIFRAPLIVAFDDFTTSTWVCIAVSSLLFGSLHLANTNLRTMIKLASERSEDEKRRQMLDNTTPSEADEFIKRELAEEKVRNPEPLAVKIASTISPTLMGFLVSYLGIKYQSVFVAFGIHSAWNFLLLPLLYLVGIIRDTFKEVFHIPRF